MHKLLVNDLQYLLQTGLVCGRKQGRRLKLVCLGEIHSGPVFIKCRLPPFDGLHYRAYVDGEAVLYRAMTDIYPNFQPLRIQQVGLAANWEWGNDTGSRFTRFEAKDRPGV